MSQDPLDYQILLQEALRDVVRRSLEIVAEQGLPGEHHFYLSFATGEPGVMMPPHLKDVYPEEMTIVLQNRFEDLVVSDDAFSVGLYFGGSLQHLTVPFDALLAFADPSEEFQVAFLPVPPEADEAPAPAAAESDAAPDTARTPGDNVVSFPGPRPAGSRKMK